MTNETRLIWIGFLATWLIALALVGAFTLGQGWKMQKPFPFAPLVIVGQLIALASMALIGWLAWLAKR